MNKEKVIQQIKNATSDFQNKGAILTESGELYRNFKLGNVLIQIVTDYDGGRIEFSNENSAEYSKIFKRWMIDYIDAPYVYWLINKLGPDEFLQRGGKLKELQSFDVQLTFVMENWDKILEMFNNKNYKKTIKAYDKLDKEIGDASMNYTEEELFEDAFSEDKVD